MASQNQIDKKAVQRYLERLRLIKQSGHVNPFETDKEKLERINRARKDVAFCAAYYFPHYTTSPSAWFHLDLARRTRKNPTAKILVRWGRGLAKSVWCDIIIPYWLWLNGEDVYQLQIGNNESKAQILLSDLQAEFESNPAILNDFGEQKTMGSWQDGYFITSSGFIGQAIGMGQSPRGLRYKNRRPNYIVPDDLDDRDLIKNPKRIDEMADWINHDVIPTMDGPVRRLLVPNNRAFRKTIQSTLEEQHPEWTLHQINAYDKDYNPAWEAKYTKEYYKSIEHEIGVIAAQAEYNNRPHLQGKVFKDSMIQWAKIPRLNLFTHIVAHWDIAYSGANDYNAVKIWGVYQKNFYCIRAFCRQCKMREAIEWMIDFDLSMPMSVMIHWQYESQFWNESVLQTIETAETKKGHRLNLWRVDTPKTKKYDRILTMHPLYQNGRVYYNINEKGSNDMSEALDQLKGIEPGYRTHDDSPDADHQALEWLQKHGGRDTVVPIVGNDERVYEAY